MTIIHSRDLTAAEFTTISARYGPYDMLSEFWDGFATYQGEAGRYRCPHGWSHSVPSRAWHHGHDAALRVRWERKIPARDDCERDDRETALQIATLERLAEERKNGS